MAPRRQGSSLVELMVAVAIVGIVAGLSGVSVEGFGGYALRRERALLLAEYHATRLVQGEALDAAVEARLRAELPSAAVVVTEDAQGVARVVVEWEGAFGRRESRSITVFAPRGGAP
ncbi:hypothetical protein LBMAG42_09020 [Deltaproteobacteria bacterium]|nr:hypothetical protein LBMAG42_09020 [Deltaproteobacteria bacterium]